MSLFWTELDYLLALALWMVLMADCLRALLRVRRILRRSGRLSRGNAAALGLALALWSVPATVTALEVVFVLFVDQSDAFNGTNVSKRWFRRYIDGQRNDGGRGFRDRRTLDMPVPKGAKRIVVYGDSFVAGHGIQRMDDRFTERLERAFNADGVERVQVHNLGEPGYEISMIEAIMQATLETYGAIDVVIYCYMMNDIEGYDPRTEQFLREINSRAPTHPLITRTYFLNWVYFRWQQLRTDAAVNYFPHLKDSYSTPAWLSVAASLDRMKQRCEAKGVEFRLVVFPFMQDLGPDYPFRDAHQKLADWARDHNVPLIDMEPLLAAHRHEGLAVNAFDAHPNVHANKLIADAIYEWLKTDPRLTAPDKAAR
jgi:lysophospholipase L1-like esterase